LEGGPPSFGPRFTGVVLLRNVIGSARGFVYGTIALSGARFHALRLPRTFVTPARKISSWTERPTTPDTQRLIACTYPVWAGPFSLATTQGVSVDLLSSGY
jgi:hypothetical protein